MNRYDYLIVGGNFSMLNVSLRMVLIFELVVDVLGFSGVTKKKNDCIEQSRKLMRITGCVGLGGCLLSGSHWIILMLKHWSTKYTSL
jgi:ethanolamine transporter EutH